MRNFVSALSFLTIVPTGRWAGKLQGDSARFKQILYIVLSQAVELSLEEDRVLLTVSFNDGFLKICLKNDPSAKRNTESLNGTYPPNDPWDFGQEDSPVDVRLALAQKLIQLHGGDIGLEYDEKGGSQLWFTLPKHKVSSPDAEDKKTESQVKSGGQPLRILLVDDNDNIQNLIFFSRKNARCLLPTMAGRGWKWQNTAGPI